MQKPYRAIIMALAICGLASSVTADPVMRFTTGAPRPPQQYLDLGLARQAQGLVTIDYVPLGQVSSACGASTSPTPGRVRTGCTISHGGSWTVIVGARLDNWYQQSVVTHELGHVGGWNASHSN